MQNDRFNHFTAIACPCCDSKSYKIVFRSTLTKNDFQFKIIKNNLKNTLDDYTKHGQIVRCLSCSLVYANPQENVSKLLSGYEAVEDPEYIRTEKFRMITLREHLKRIELFKQKGKLLDIGCFAGYFLSLAKKNGWNIYGIEPSIWARKIALQKGIFMIGKNIETVRLRKDFFDAVTLLDVIEHLSNPNKIIEKVYTCLKHGGIIALGTPNIESLFAKILGAKCPFLIRMHLIFFSPKTLRKLLEKNGFRVVSVSYYGRIFPISYILDRIQTNNIIIKTIKKTIKNFPFIANMPIKLNFHDSFFMIARKK